MMPPAETVRKTIHDHRAEWPPTLEIQCNGDACPADGRALPETCATADLREKPEGRIATRPFWPWRDQSDEWLRADQSLIRC